MKDAIGTPPPAWAEDLIIYEVATRGFTSPAGPESGTFASLAEKLGHIADLGANGIWLTGHSLGDPHHFYNIWTQYANIEPDKLDPSLGTEADFRAMIGAAHDRGLKVFLDVHVHGVVAHSPLIEKKPEWFRKDTKLAERWGMADYDWQGDHPDLDAWWVKIWSDLVVDYGIDGYRLDVGVFRPDLWAKVREAARKAGRSIVIFSEGGEAIPGVTDFTQGGFRVNDQRRDGVLSDTPLLRNLAALYREERMATKIKNGFVTAQLSCHDSGWEGFPADGNPFVAEGSRCVFGYSVLFSPMIPVFMGGEEFDATFRPLPGLSPQLFGGSDPGKGTWLYGAMLDWNEVGESPHREMLEDARRMIAIRRREASVLRPTSPGQERVDILEVPRRPEGDLPVPYLRWHGGEAIVVAGNPDPAADAEIRLDIPVARTSLPVRETYLVEDLWNGGRRRVSRADLGRLPCTVARDQSPRGGVAVLKITAA